MPQSSQSLNLFQSLILTRGISVATSSSFSLFSPSPSPWLTFFRRYLSTNHANDAQIEVLGRRFTRDDYTNVTQDIIEKTTQRLHKHSKHPLGLIKRTIEHFFDRTYQTKQGEPVFRSFDELCPIVTTKQNFDELLIPMDHVSRRKTDTYYLNKDTLLRCHTSAHQTELIRHGHRAFLATGDVYRRDEIDGSHYPVFHQMEGVRVFDPRSDLSPKGKTTPFIIRRTV